MATSGDRNGCASRRAKGMCDNGQTITGQAIEARVLGGLRDKLFAPEPVAEFVYAFQEGANATRVTSARLWVRQDPFMPLRFNDDDSEAWRRGISGTRKKTKANATRGRPAAHLPSRLRARIGPSRRRAPGRYSPAEEPTARFL
jgi:hypothetical protein